MSSSATNRKPIIPPGTDFDSYICPPRDPTPGERTKLLLRFDGYSVDIYAVPLKIIAPPTAAYNSLGWAVQRLRSILDYPLYFEPDTYDTYMLRFGCEPVFDPDLATIEVWGVPDLHLNSMMVVSFSRRIGGREKRMWSTKKGSEELIVHDRYDWRALAHGPKCRVLRGYKERDDVSMARTIAALEQMWLDDDLEPLRWPSLETGKTPGERYENRQLLKEADAIVARATAAGSSSLADHVRPPASTYGSSGRPVNGMTTFAPPHPEVHHPPSQHDGPGSGARGRGDRRGRGGMGVDSRVREWESQGTQEGGMNPTTFPEVPTMKRPGRNGPHLTWEELRAAYAPQESGEVTQGSTEMAQRLTGGAPRGPSRASTRGYRGAPRR